MLPPPARSAAFALLAALLVSGCADSPVAPPGPPAVHDPDSPAAVVRQLEQAWNERDTTRVQRLLTDDFEFVFSAADSAGNPFRASPWDIEDEIRACRHLFGTGSDGRPAADRITLMFERTLMAVPDDRPGRDPAAHRMIWTSVTLSVLVSEGGVQSSFEVQGKARFFLVRGDSARVDPPAGAGRWFLERWEDETLPTVAKRSMPAQSRTIGQLKALYH